MKFLKNAKWFTLGVAVCLTAMLFVVPALASVTRQETLTFRDITVTLDGQAIIPLDFEGNPVEPFIIGGTTFLPVRGIATVLGLDVDWDGETNTVILTTPGITDPVEPDPVEPDPVEPDPVEPDPVEPDPVEPDPVEPDDPAERTGHYVFDWTAGHSVMFPRTTVAEGENVVFEGTEIIISDSATVQDLQFVANDTMRNRHENAGYGWISRGGNEPATTPTISTSANLTGPIRVVVYVSAYRDSGAINNNIRVRFGDEVVTSRTIPQGVVDAVEAVNKLRLEFNFEAGDAPLEIYLDRADPSRIRLHRVEIFEL